VRRLVASQIINPNDEFRLRFPEEISQPLCVDVKAYSLVSSGVDGATHLRLASTSRCFALRERIYIRPLKHPEAA
jgi:hypothetical protein